VGEWLETLRKEWPVVKDVPWAFGIAVVVCAGIVWAFVHLLHRHEIAGMRASLDLLERQCREKDLVIRELNPQDTAFTAMSNHALQQRTLTFARRLREFYREQDERERQIAKYDEQQFKQALEGGTSGSWYTQQRNAQEEKRSRDIELT
jgi:hypothetical protein